MGDYKKVVGTAMKKPRLERKLTQQQLSELSGVDIRVIGSLERFEGNPKLENLYALINTLQIDAREVFGIHGDIESATVRQMHHLIDGFSEEEASQMLSIMESVVAFSRSKNQQPV